MLDEKFNLHGSHATTMGGCPILIVNGPIRNSISLNCRLGVLGSGTRVNASIGRAIKLVLQNVGGARLGGTESTTLGSPNKWGLCIGELEELLEEEEEESPIKYGKDKPPLKRWVPYHVTRGFKPSENVVTVMAVTGGPYQLVDFKTTSSYELCRSMARIIKTLYESRIPLLNHVLCVISPEHWKLLSSDGVKTKKQFQKMLFDHCNRLMVSDIPFIVARLLGPRLSKKPIFKTLSKFLFPLRVILLGILVAVLKSDAMQNNVDLMLGVRIFIGTMILVLLFTKSLSEIALWGLGYFLAGICWFSSNILNKPLGIVPKVCGPDSFQVIVAGGGAGKFSAFFPGFGVGRDGPLANMTIPISRTIINDAGSGGGGEEEDEEFKEDDREGEARSENNDAPPPPPPPPQSERRRVASSRFGMVQDRIKLLLRKYKLQHSTTLNDKKKEEKDDQQTPEISPPPPFCFLNPKMEQEEEEEDAAAGGGGGHGCSNGSSLIKAARTGKLEGPIAFLDISKGNGDILLDRLQSKLQEQYPHIKIMRFVKPTFSRPCPFLLMREILTSGAKHAVAALAD